MTDWPDLAGRLDGRHHRLPIRVYFEDTDFSGIVYHATYLRFMERGRSDFLRLFEVHHRDLADGSYGTPVAFAVKKMTLDFRAPARIDDILEVDTQLAQITAARLTLDQEVRRGEQVLVAAQVEAVVISADGRPRRLPKPVLERLKPLLPDAVDGSNELSGRG
ncbi:tol-pal system-associated acyl-CoA thioesterase [Amorphus sp. 3PC139-8]|uniref:tol-pal system-associated acyl-CoA thioesterase n=1 Tax=Amorphus sp. 3PC139-8 TaxID=2735676 RepID=UPI00345DABD2